MLRHLVVVASVTALAAACASAPADPNAPQACVVVDNSSGGGALGRVYLVEASGISGVRTMSQRDLRTELQRRRRIRIGQVGTGRSQRFCTQNLTLPGTYLVSIEEPSADRMDPAARQTQPPVRASETFRLEAWDEVTYHVSQDRITCQPEAGRGGGDC